MNLFTPTEETKVKHLLSTLDDAETQICILANLKAGKYTLTHFPAFKG